MEVLKGKRLRDELAPISLDEAWCQALSRYLTERDIDFTAEQFIHGALNQEFQTCMLDDQECITGDDRFLFAYMREGHRTVAFAKVGVNLG